MATRKTPRTFSNESALKTAIIKLLRANGILCWRVGAGPYSVVGLPDIMGVLPAGRLLAIEVKQPGNSPDTHQAQWLDDLAAAGARAFWVDSIEEVEAWLKAYQA